MPDSSHLRRRAYISTPLTSFFHHHRHHHRPTNLCTLCNNNTRGNAALSQPSHVAVLGHGVRTDGSHQASTRYPCCCSPSTSSRGITILSCHGLEAGRQPWHAPCRLSPPTGRQGFSIVGALGREPTGSPECSPPSCRSPPTRQAGDWVGCCGWETNRQPQHRPCCCSPPKQWRGSISPLWVVSERGTNLHSAPPQRAWRGTWGGMTPPSAAEFNSRPCLLACACLCPVHVVPACAYGACLYVHVVPACACGACLCMCCMPATPTGVFQHHQGGQLEGCRSMLTCRQALPVPRHAQSLPPRKTAAPRQHGSTCRPPWHPSNPCMHP